MNYGQLNYHQLEVRISEEVASLCPAVQLDKQSLLKHLCNTLYYTCNNDLY